ncbi:hypothetical protein HHI36_011062 [Cryptolaemus montrouzieri]|uniref:Uncharacterized protein n=1 Tax=Cryptolaemus montrouzieri TaxID=559131 RepID=A0ABD2MKP4_9CUCU
MHGLEFLVHTSRKDEIIHFEPKTHRLCFIRIGRAEKAMTIVDIQAPTEEKEAGIKDNLRNWKRKEKSMMKTLMAEMKKKEILGMELKFKKKEKKNFYKDIKDLRIPEQNSTPFYESKERNLIGDEKETLSRHYQYFEELLNNDVNDVEEIESQTTYD